MRIFVAGPSGAIGKRLVPMLMAKGHQVTAMTRKPDSVPMLRNAGADPVVADALDRSAVLCAVESAAPECIVHEMTALAGVTDYKNFDKAFGLTNQLRTRGTDNLIEAGRAIGVRRIIAQSYGNWNYARTGGQVKTERDPLDSAPPPAARVLCGDPPA